jgi:hypothetical protein
MKKGKPPRVYEVGYGKPPKGTRWSKGTSGNPRGRPKKKISIQDLLIQELNKSQRVVDEGVQKRLTTKEIIVKRACRKLMQETSIKELKQILEMITALEARYEVPEDAIPKSGVLVVTGTLSEEEWERKASEKCLNDETLLD